MWTDCWGRVRSTSYITPLRFQLLEERESRDQSLLRLVRDIVDIVVFYEVLRTPYLIWTKTTYHDIKRGVLPIEPRHPALVAPDSTCLLLMISSFTGVNVWPVKVHSRVANRDLLVRQCGFSRNKSLPTLASFNRVEVRILWATDYNDVTYMACRVPLE